MPRNLPAQFGPFLLTELLGLGGMAEIFKAHRGDPERPIVIKRILPSFADNPVFVQMLIQEAQIARALHHDNIVGIREMGQIDGVYFICMDYVHGSDLLKILAKCSRQKVFLPMDLVAFLVSNAADGLHYAHHAVDEVGTPLGIIHRDVSPGNILLSYTGDVKITDFGVARASRFHDASGPAEALKGKAGYMSPEMVTGRKFDSRADIFGLGVLLFEAMTRKHLFLGKDEMQTLLNIRDCQVEPRLKRHDYIPEAIQNIIRTATNTEPEGRYATAGALAADLKTYLKDSRSPADPDTMGRVVQTVAGWGSLPLSSQPCFLKDVFPGRAARGAEGRAHDEPQMATAPSRTPITQQRTLKDDQYLLHRRDGAEDEPVSFEVVRRMIVHGALTQTDLVSTDGVVWGRVDSFPLLKPWFEKHSLISSASPSSEGHASIISLPFVLYQLAEAKRSGVLVAKSSTTVFEVHLSGGDLIHVQCNDPGLLFGSYLVRNGVITMTQAHNVVLEEVEKSEARLGELLTKHGYVDRESIAEHLAQHQVERLRSLLTTKQGWFGFYEPEGLSLPAPTGGLPLAALVTEQLRNTLDPSVLERLFRGKLNDTLVVHENAPERCPMLGFNKEELKIVASLFLGGTLKKQLAKGPDRESLLLAAFVMIESQLIGFLGHPTPFDLKVPLDPGGYALEQ